MPRHALFLAALAACAVSACSRQDPGLGDFGPHDAAGMTSSGAYPTEQRPDGTAYRWTNGDAIITLPARAGFAPKELDGTLEALTAVPVSVSVGGRELMRQGRAVGVISLKLDVSGIDFSQPQKIEIRTGTWKPNSKTDPRTLGVEIVQLEFKP
jgi:hypothetical protein